MKKREALHVHALLRAVKQQIEADEEVEESAFEEYESLSVRPEQIYKNKEHHEEAVLTLTRSIAGTVSEETSDSSNEEPREAAPAQ